jgi:GTP-binding protein
LAEAGEFRLNATEWRFITGAAALDGVPPPAGPEIAFAGRSNVGKSSLINRIAGNRNVARVSNTPGRTQQVNFFSVGERLIVADLPGYGYAAAPKETVAGWTELIRLYLKGRVPLRQVMLLIDGRHGIKPNDTEIMELLDSAAVPYQVILTKADKLKRGEAERIRTATEAALKKHPAARPEVLVTSAEDGTGIEALRALISTLAEERFYPRR